ncbi:Protein of unknown function [Pedobacter steynii]|uniref:DUF1360 domain-containing protein n=1 Tax=Pedobacter steynii TaxID=430522 RepID=A0A1G9JLQ8_9SPHI|nr:DUF1360 domain-containing protein [Pedobacter steynii]NQX38288.1 DUF1360 domain-containing protein [Pedobacter steynii]SDL38242.1 Protein of unknown function [Pedobacter steynii]
MTAYLFLISVLAVWRVTHLIQAEDGPFDIIYKLRKLAGESFFGSLMDCFFCLSIWVALPVGIYFGNDWMEKVLLTLSFSAAAIFLEQIIMKKN